MNRAEAHLSKLPGYFKLVHKWETNNWGENEADFGYK